MKTILRTAVSASAVATLLAGGRADAGGFAVARFGGEHGHAATDHVTAVFYNPAGLALGSGTRGYVEGFLAFRSVDYVRDEGAIDNRGTGTPDEAIEVNSGAAKLRNFLVSPFLGVASDFGIDGLGVGIGVYAPFGGQATWDKVDRWNGDAEFLGRYPGAPDGPQRWSAIDGVQRTLYYSLAAAWRTPSRRFAIGASVSVAQSTISLIRARNVPGTDDLVTRTGVVTEGRSLLEVDDLTVAASVGAIVHVTPCFKVGATYQSQPGFGENTLEGTLINKFGASGESEKDVELHQELPDSIGISAEWHAFLHGALRVGALYTRWSKFRNQCLLDKMIPNGKCEINDDGSARPEVLINIPRDWKDNFGVRVGGSWWPLDTLEINAGITFDSNAIPSSTLEAALVDSNKVLGTLGASWRLGPATIEPTLGYVYYDDRTTRPRETDLQFPSRNPDMAGTYKQQAIYMLIGLGVGL